MAEVKQCGFENKPCNRECIYYDTCTRNPHRYKATYEHKAKETPYQKLLREQDMQCCKNCQHLYQHKKRNEVEGTDHVNYCKKNGKLILEINLDGNRAGRNCFERKR